MKVGMRMIYAKRMLLCGDVVSEHKVKLIVSVTTSCYRCDSVVWLSICLCKNKCFFICIASPCKKNLICKINKLIPVCRLDSDNRHRPFYDTCLDILVALECDFFLYRSLCHSEGIVSALEMVVT